MSAPGASTSTRGGGSRGTADVLVVGAGLAGLVAARTLQARGAAVTLVDKGHRPGGRCATRRIDEVPLDTGAQFFTVRSEAFRSLVDRWRADGVGIHRWASGFARAASVADDPASARTADDGHPRYAVTGGMNRLAAHLATGLDLRCRVRVTAVSRSADGWVARTPHGTGPSGRALVLTPPVPQTLALLAAGGVDLPDSAEAALRPLAYEPCLALLLVLDGDPRLPGPGAVQFTDGPVAWMADNAAKGVAPAPAVTVHAGAGWSAAGYDDPDDAIAERLLAAVQPWLHGASVRARAVFRWRYAKPVGPRHDGAVVAEVGGGRLAVAGDALAGAKVEGAVASGLAAARALR